jgi:hypothetical protein
MASFESPIDVALNVRPTEAGKGNPFKKVLNLAMASSSELTVLSALAGR